MKKRNWSIKVPVFDRSMLCVKRRTAIIIVVVFFAVIIAALIAVCAHAEGIIPQATEQFYVNDFGEVFTDSQEQDMVKKAAVLAEKPEGVQVVVTTVKSLDGYSVEDYATQMYNQYGIGKDDRGVLILLSTGERQIRVEVGYELESYLTDSKAGRFIDNYAISYLKNNQFDQGLISLQKAIVEDLDSHFESLRVTSKPQTKEDPGNQEVNQEPITRSNVSNEVQSVDSEENNTNGVIELIGWILAGLMLFGFVLQSYNLRKSMKERDFEQDHYRQNTDANNKTINELRTKNMELREQNRVQSESYTDIVSEKNRAYENLKGDKLRLQSRLDSLQKEFDALNKKFDATMADYAKLQDRYVRAVMLHGRLNSEIDEMIQKEIDEKNRQVASEFDKKFEAIAVGIPFSDSDFEMFRHAFVMYKGLNSEQQQYVKTDMDDLHSRYEEGMNQKSKEEADLFCKEVKDVCEPISHGTEAMLPKLQRMYDKYNRMEQRTKGFVDMALVTVLVRLIDEGESVKATRLAAEEAERRRFEEEERKRKEAERKRKEEEERKRREEERRRQEEEEERRRRERRRREEEERRRTSSMHHSSSSFGSSSSHFGGFGGHSGGGGASRGF